MADKPQMAWVRSDGLTLEVRLVDPVVVVFVADKTTGLPLPLRNDVMSLEDSRILIRELAASGKFRRTL